MSDTPRMKAAQMAAMEHGTGDVWRVGCDIERELNAANDRIKRLEEAGIKLRECASQLGWTSSDDFRWIKRAESAVKAWDKEVKL